MSRRAPCEGPHQWLPNLRSGGSHCANCPATFPCATDCAHFDCVEARGKDPNCGVCGKPVKMDEAFFTSRGDKLIANHPTCVNSNTTEEEHGSVSSTVT